MTVSKYNESKFLKTIKSLKIEEPFLTELLSGGLSGSEVIKVDTFNKTYVVRLWNLQWVDYFSQDLTCQIIASEAGYGPKVHFLDEKECITVMDYHSSEPIAKIHTRLEALVTLLKKIHSGPPVPKGIDRSIYLDLLIEENTPSKLFNLEVIKTIKNTVLSTTRLKANCVPCHRDLHHGNLLYTKGNFLAIDYTWGAMDDPYADLANIALFHCETPEDEIYMLQLYLGRAPKAEEIARLSLMKLPAKIFYGLEFLGVSSANTSHQNTLQSKIYKNFGEHGQPPFTCLDYLGYATALLTEVLEYSNTQQYLRDLDQVS